MVDDLGGDPGAERGEERLGRRNPDHCVRRQDWPCPNNPNRLFKRIDGAMGGYGGGRSMGAPRGLALPEMCVKQTSVPTSGAATAMLLAASSALVAAGS